MSRLLGSGTHGSPASTIVLVVLLGGGGLGAGSLIGGPAGPTQADLDAVKAEISAAQAASQIELLEAQNAQLKYNAGLGYWQADNMRKLAGALRVVGQHLELDLDLSISKLEVAR